MRVATKLLDERGGELGGAVRRIAHPPAGAVAVEPVRDVDVLLEVIA